MLYFFGFLCERRVGEKSTKNSSPHTPLSKSSKSCQFNSHHLDQLAKHGHSVVIGAPDLVCSPLLSTSAQVGVSQDQESSSSLQGLACGHVSTVVKCFHSGMPGAHVHDF